MRGTAAILRQQFGSGRYISNYFANADCRDAQSEEDPDVMHQPFVLPQRYSFGWFEEQLSRRVFRKPMNIGRVTHVFERSLQQSDIVFLLGGDNYSLDYRDVDVHFRLLEMAIQSKKPTVIWGASVGPFDNDPKFERYASEILQQVPLICARETETIKYLASIGVTENVAFAADPAFYLTPNEVALPEKIQNILSQRCLGINLSPLMARYLGSVGFNQSSMDSWQRTAIEIIEHVLNNFSEPVLLIPHVTSDNGQAAWRDDYLLLKSLAEEFTQSNRVHVIPPTLNASETKWVIGQVALFAGARTHSTIAAMSSNVPTVFIGYSMKARGLAQDAFGHLDWLIDSQELVSSPSLLAEKMTELVKKEELVHEQLAAMNPIFRERGKNAAALAAGLMGSS